MQYTVHMQNYLHTFTVDDGGGGSKNCVIINVRTLQSSIEAK